MNTFNKNKVLKKITVLESSNYMLNDNVKHLPLANNLDTKDLKTLRDYTLGCINLLKYDDPHIIFKVMEWVSSQWQHDGMNEAPSVMSSYEILQKVKKGERYRCVEYGKVASDILLSLGYISRQIKLRSKDVAYGSFSRGHVATEIWSNNLEKWIFIDPQFCIYAKYKDEYLNFYDMYKLKCKNLFNDIEFIVPKDYLKKNNIKLYNYIESYKKFIINYFGYISAGYIRDGKNLSLTLLLDGDNPYLTFQGLTQNNLIFTKEPRDFYYSINNSIIIFEYREDVKFKDIVEKYNLDTHEDYIRHMPYFAPKPDFTLTFENNMKWFSHYEINKDNKGWVKINSNQYHWSLDDGINVFSLRGVNTAGNKGVPTTLKINYGE